MQEAKISGAFQFGGKTLAVNLKVVLFEEEAIFFAYLPSLDLTGYGKTIAEAKDSLKIVLDEYLRYTLNKNTFFIDLQRLGWNMKSKKKLLTPPQMSDLIHSNEQLRDIINHKQFTTSNYTVNLPALA
jgi:hypothetical protein